MVGLQPDVSTFCLPDISYMTLLHMMSDETFQHLPLSYAYRQRMSANKLCACTTMHCTTGTTVEVMV